MTGFTSGTGPITASDNILQAIQKLDGNKGWSLQGNSATDASNFLGTSDDKPLQFRVNNVQSGLINKTDETTFLGYEAGLANTGTGNLAVGFQALKSNTTAQQNTAIGYQALYNNNSNGQNTAVGYQALYNNTMGYNTAIGIQALYSNVSGFYNTAIGQNALYFNDSGFSNVALGMGSLQANTTGYRNIGIGRYALAGNGAGSDNIAMGYFASASAGGGTDNFAVGYQSLMVNTGSRNTGIGHQVLVNNTGSDNLAIGYQSLFSNTTGGKNTAIGNYAGYYNTGSNRLYFDSFDRGSSAGDDAGAIIQGTMNASPSNQLLVLNASTTVSSVIASADPTSGALVVKGGLGSAGDINSGGKITGTSIVKSGGTAVQFLKADGSVDTNSYLTSGTGVSSISGTANQITASGGIGAVTLSLPATINGLTSVSSTGFTGDLTGNITGNAATVTTNANLTGEVTSTGNATTVANSAVIGKVLTGFTSGTGPITASDNILQAIQKLDGNSVANANATHTGDVTGATALTISNDAVTTPKILNSNVTYAKIQNVSGSDKVLGRISPGAGNLEEIGTTGSGNVVRATSPTLVTPDLGTPSAEVGTNITGTAAGLTAGHVLTNADLTGEVTSTGNVTTVTNSAVIGKVLTGFTSGTGPITASDNILQAIQKLDGNKGWSLQGNSATDASNFLGTSDDKPLQFRVNNVQSGLINKTDETTFLGYEAGLANTGTGNLAVGFQALKSNTTAQQNTAIGYQALYNNNSNGQNTAVGYQALYNNTMGYNTAIGIQALYSNVSGFYNTAIGQNALYFNDSGFSNVALGMGSLQANTTGYRNIGIGRYALAGNGAGSDNIAMGYFASASAGGGTDNFAVGYQSLMVNTGSRNTGIGHQVLVNNTGSDNLAIGYQSLFSNTTGGKNTAIGNYAGYYNTGSNRLYFDSFDRGSSAGDDAGAIIQGTMDATPSNQLLVLNASTTVRGALKVSGSNISANPTSERVDGILLNAAMGNLMLRTTMPNDIGLSANSGTHFQFFTDDSSNRISAGSITSSGSATSFNTTSDYRLKQDFKSFSGLSLIRKIKIYDYQWIADKTRMYGVKAHELQEVLPYAVTGAKDAIDKEGKPVYQSVDYSKIVPVLVKGMQELQTTIETQQKQIEELRTMVELLLKK